MCIVELVNYPGYGVDDIGNIYTKHKRGPGLNNLHGHWSQMKPIRGKDGYLKINLSSFGVTRTLRVHRLVASVFCPNPMGLPQVNHKDCDKLNNNADNLEWCSVKENARHAIFNGRYRSQIGEKNNLHKLTYEDVDKILLMLSMGSSQSEIAKLFGVRQTSISNIATGKTWRKRP